MPMNRYEIRNEYSLADPELYRAADKDDPEALLEGVAMAGLVGVLRQLGDLAEFAAEIFHDLHEEVMVTAARGHGLMIRVQQLEAEVPSIEKAFLSQTDHSSFFYNTGVDWHPNLQMDQNLVTQGDLPRFVMDSYEECRGPPRLFLLDKFDVAGAGACLKRYTDPSFFKVETSAMANADIQREKKIRKAKKKGPRGRYRETPEVLPASHAKLHQLFLEPDENSVSKPAHRAKLKRRPSGFPFDSKTGKSYMEKLLKSPSPEHKTLHEITASSPLQKSTDDDNESDLDVLELRSVSPPRDNEGRKINTPSPDREDAVRNPFVNQTNDRSTDIKIYGVPSYLNIVTDGIPSSFDENGEKDITVYGESKTEGSLAGYQSDEIASEIDNYVDAPSTIESEMDTDSELRVKNDFTSSYIKNQPKVSIENEEHLRSQSSDSQSTGDLTISDEGSNSCKREVSSFLSSDSSRTSAENPQSEKLSAEGLPCADVPEIATVNPSSYQKTADEEFSVNGLPEIVVSNNTIPGKDAPANHSPDFEQLTSDLCSSSSIPILPLYDSGEVMRKGRLMGPKSDETDCTSDDEEKKTNLIVETSCSRSVSCSKSLSGDDSPRSSSGEHLIDGENAPSMSTVANVTYHTSDSSAAIPAYLLHKDGNNLEDLNQLENMNTTLNIADVSSQNRIDTEEIISNESPTLDKLDNEVTKLPHNFASDSTDIVHGGHNITLKVPEGERQNDDLYNEDSNAVSDAPNHLSCIMEAFTGKEFGGTSLTNAETVDSEDHYSSSSIVNQISSETLIVSAIEDSSDSLEADLDAHDRDFIPEETTTVNEIPELDTPESCEVVGLQGTGITDDVTPNDLVALKSSFCMPENLEDPAGTSDTAEKDGVDPHSSITGLEPTEISSSADQKLLNEVHVLSDESDTKTDQLETATVAHSVAAVSDNTIRENVGLSAGLDKLVEECIPCFENSGLVEHENDKITLSGSNKELELVELENNYLSGSLGQSGLVEDADEREAAILDYHTVVCNTENNDHPKSEVPHMGVSSYLDFEVEHRVDSVDATQIRSPLNLSGLDTDQESFQQSGVGNQASDANSLPIECITEETILQEKIELPPQQIDQEPPDSGELSSELSSPLPVDHQKMLDHDNNKGYNNFVSLFPVVNYPPSVSELSGLRNCGIDVSAYPRDPSGFIFPTSNLFSTNQINLDESPPLPPLPPLQWRIGKLQHASSTTEVDRKEHKEVFPQEISPPAASTGNISSLLEQMNHSQVPREISPSAASTGNISSSLEQMNHSPVPREISPSAASTDDISSSIEQMNHSQVPQEISPSAASTSNISSLLEQMNHSPFPQEISPSAASTGDISSSLEQMNHSQVSQEISPSAASTSNISSLLEQMNHSPFPREISPSAASTGDISSSLEQMNHSQVQIVPQISLKEESVEHGSPSLEANSMHEKIDLPSKIENEQQQLVMPTQKSEVTSPAEEDGVAYGSRTLKLPRTCNPLIGSAAALDKSKLRKVTERDRLQVQKPDERDSLLEQIRAKSFNLKPAVGSRPSTQRPKTNLNVAAILEKANAIRQALAGSDEDDDDNWSDS